MKTQIIYLRFEYHNQRNISMGVLVEEKNHNNILCSGSILQILEKAKKEDLEIVNAQDVLDTIVRLNGFSS